MRRILKVCSGGRCKDTLFGCRIKIFGKSEDYNCSSCWLLTPAFKNCPWSRYGGKERALLPENSENDIRVERTLCFFCREYPNVSPDSFNINNLKHT